MVNVLRWLLISLIFVVLPVRALEEGVSVHNSWHYLADDRYTLEQITAPNLSWQKSKWDLPNLGFQFKPYWFRLELGQDLAPGEWYLSIQNGLLSRVDYFLLEDGAWVVKQTTEAEEASAIPRLQPALPFRYPSFSLPIEEGHKYTIYLRVYTSSTMQIPAAIFPYPGYISVKERQDTLLGVFIGVLFVMMMYNGILYLLVRDKAFLLYVGHAASLLFFVNSWQSLHILPLGATVMDRGSQIGLATFLVIGFSTWFAGVFLTIKPSNFPLTQLYWAVRNLAFVGALASLFVSEQWAILAACSLTLIALVVVVASIVYRASLRHRPTRLFIMGWSVYLIGATLMGFNVFGFIPVNIYTEHTLLWSSIFDMVLIGIALGDKYHIERNLKVRTQTLAINALHREKQAKDEELQKEQMARAALDDAATMQAVYAYDLEQRVAERKIELNKTLTELESLSEQDALTGLKNRRFFSDHLDQELKRSQLSGSQFSLLMIDIDHFKSINDTYGHLVGDACIRSVGQLLQRMFKRQGDIVCRYGGEEFVVVVPDVESSKVMDLAEMVRRRMAEFPIHCGEQHLMVTVSVGVLIVRAPAKSDTTTIILNRADQALYEAKAAGRNCVCSAQVG